MIGIREREKRLPYENGHPALFKQMMEISVEYIWEVATSKPHLSALSNVVSVETRWWLGHGGFMKCS